MLQAIIRLPTAWLVERLQLPPSTVIEAAQLGFDDPGLLRLRVRGVGFPMIYGTLVGGAPIEPMVFTHVAEDGRRHETVQWSFPKEPSHG